jgi:hypothetical protein
MLLRTLCLALFSVSALGGGGHSKPTAGTPRERAVLLDNDEFSRDDSERDFGSREQSSSILSTPAPRAVVPVMVAKKAPPPQRAAAAPRVLPERPPSPMFPRAAELFPALIFDKAEGEDVKPSDIDGYFSFKLNEVIGMVALRNRNDTFMFLAVFLAHLYSNGMREVWLDRHCFRNESVPLSQVLDFLSYLDARGGGAEKIKSCIWLPPRTFQLSLNTKRIKVIDRVLEEGTDPKRLVSFEFGNSISLPIFKIEVHPPKGTTPPYSGFMLNALSFHLNRVSALFEREFLAGDFLLANLGAIAGVNLYVQLEAVPEKNTDGAIIQRWLKYIEPNKIREAQPERCLTCSTGNVDVRSVCEAVVNQICPSCNQDIIIPHLMPNPE